MGAENPLIPLVINAVHAVDAISTELGGRVADHVQAQRSVTQEMMGAIGRIVEQYYGSTPADALTSPMYQAILEQKLLGGWAAVRQFSWMYRHLVGPAVAAQLDEMADQYMDELDRHDENVAALARMHAPVVAGGAGEEPVLSLMAATSNAKTKRAWQRYRNSAFQKANYSWVTGDKKPLSWRVWNTGASTQEAIRKQLVESIRAGDSPATLGTKLEQYLKPEFAPTQYLKNGKIVKKNIATGGGSYAARRLARTELTKTNGEWTVNLVKTTPGALGTKWNLSGSHPAYDVCDQKAKGGSGKAPFIPGVYGPGNPPRYPAHPQCLCYLTPYMKSRQQVLDDLKKQYPTLKIPAAPPPPAPAAKPFTGPGSSGYKSPAQKMAEAKAKQAAKQAATTASPPVKFTSSEFEDFASRVYSRKFKARLTAAPQGQEMYSALASYKDGAYSEMNNLLRKGAMRYQSQYSTPDRYHTLNDLVARSFDYAEPIGKPLTVYRGTSSNTVFREMSQLQPGDTVVDAGFVSTSTSTRVAHGSFGGGGYSGASTLMTIELPADTKGIWLDTIAAPREKELLLNKDATFIVKSISKTGKKLHLFLEYIPK